MVCSLATNAVYLPPWQLASYPHRGSNVYGCFLDASKAFDLVDHGILFKRLLERNLPLPIVRLLLVWYRDQRMQVRWNHSLSRSFLSPMVSARVASCLQFYSFCEDFALSHGLKFNTSKTQLIHFESSSCSYVFYFCGASLPLVDSVTHLGHVLRFDLDDCDDITRASRVMVRKSKLHASFVCWY